MSEQSKLGAELNRIMLETGMTPLQTMSAYMHAGSKKLGNHVFVAKAPTKDKAE